MSVEETLSNMFELNVRPQLSSDELRMLSEYTTFQSGLVSAHLLYKDKDPECFKEWIKNIILLLNRTIKLSPLPFPLTVYHGTGDAMFDHHNIIDYKKEHTSFTNVTFLSTSLSQKVAHSFSFHNIGNKNVLNIFLPKGYPALWMENITRNKNEKELVLLNSQEFIFGKSYKSDYDSATYTDITPKMR